MSAIVFLDRDGVLNHCQIGEDGVPRPPRTLEDLALLPGVEAACKLLKQHGYRLVMVTNQPDVARGVQRRELVEEMNAWLASKLRLDDVRVCWHDDADECRCRKPNPGLLQQTAAETGAELRQCFMVGDRWRDVEAGSRAGCTTILVGDGYGEPFESAPDHQSDSLLRVAHWLSDAAHIAVEEGGVPTEPRSSLHKGHTHVDN
jgi:D-glycero-D-manno-heptose 1,7-bisphosphate phosphatase